MYLHISLCVYIYKCVICIYIYIHICVCTIAIRVPGWRSIVEGAWFGLHIPYAYWFRTRSLGKPTCQCSVTVMRSFGLVIADSDGNHGLIVDPCNNRELNVNCIGSLNHAFL